MQVLKAKSSSYILSYGGGVNTTALMIYLIKKRLPLDEAVFADTGGELPETYRNVDLARSYLAKHGIPLRIVKSNNGTLLETCERRRVIPSQLWRWSTRDYKVRPIHRYYKSLGSQVVEYLGIAYDEIERVKASREAKVTSLFPLVDARMTRDDCIRLIAKEGFPMPIKSGCYFCPFNNEERWQYIWRNHRSRYLKATELEENSKHFPNQKLTPLTLRVLKDERFKWKRATHVSNEPCGAYCMD